MKKAVVAASFVVALTAGVAIAGMTPGTGIVGSPHDMNVITGLSDDTQGRVCAFCHTPHHALVDPTGDLQPLWSHDFSEYVSNYKSYESPTLNAGIIDPLMGPSRLCMSCHDGVVAADQHYGGTQNGTNGRLNNDNWGGVAVGNNVDNSVIGTDANFSNDHPIGFDYTAVAQVTDMGIFDASSTFIGNTGIKIEDTLHLGQFMTCATCHDVHNKDNVVNTAPGVQGNYFVYADQNGSKLCLSCHDKGE